MICTLNNINIELSNQKASFKTILGAACSGAFAIIAAQIIALIIILFIDPSKSVGFKTWGLFSELSNEPALYLSCYIIHSAVFGVIYGIFGIGLMTLIKNKYYTIVVALLFYRLSSYFPATIPIEISNLFPLYPFEFSSFDVNIGKNIYDLAIMLIIGALLITIYWVKYANYEKITCCKQQGGMSIDC